MAPYAPPPAIPVSPDAPARTEATIDGGGFDGSVGIGGPPSTGPSPNTATAGGVADHTSSDPSIPDASTLFDALAGSPLKVTTVRLKGLHRTRRAIVERELENLGSAVTVGRVRELLLADWGVLAGLGAFSTVELAMEECEPPTPGACRVTATFVERPILSLHTGTYFQGTEASVEGRLGLTNAVGHGEQVTLSIEKGSEALGEVAASLTKPRLGGRAWTGAVDAHGRTRSWAASSSFDERSIGAGLRLASDDGKHAFGYSSAWRTLADGTRHASGAVKAQAGHALKSALSYTGRAGKTVGVGPGEEGAVASYSLEVAGLGWNGGASSSSSSSSSSAASPSSSSSALGLVRHVRQQATAAWHAPLSALAPSLFGPFGRGAAWGEAVGFHLTGTVGLLVPWGGSAALAGGGGGGGRPTTPTTALSDRFFLGGFGGLSGSSTLRGFGLRGVGPVDARHVPGLSPVRRGGGNASSTSTSTTPPPPPTPDPRPWDFLGGDAAGSLTAAARVRLPWGWAQETGIFGHAFLNGGGLALLEGNGGGGGGLLSAAAGAVRASAAGARWSAGVGLVWPTVAGNLEVDWVRVLKAAPSDVSKSGLSVGFTPRS